MDCNDLKADSILIFQGRRLRVQNYEKKLKYLARSFGRKVIKINLYKATIKLVLQGWFKG